MPRNNNDACGRHEFTTEPVRAPLPTGAQSLPPETYRLPRQNERDPYWGLSRAYYYEAEKAGMLKLIRLRKKGNLRGVTLVPYRAVAELIQRASACD
jgi:hypothetical protein